MHVIWWNTCQCHPFGLFLVNCFISDSKRVKWLGYYSYKRCLKRKPNLLVPQLYIGRMYVKNDNVAVTYDWLCMNKLIFGFFDDLVVETVQHKMVPWLMSNDLEKNLQGIGGDLIWRAILSFAWGYVGDSNSLPPKYKSESLLAEPVCLYTHKTSSFRFRG